MTGVSVAELKVLITASDSASGVISGLGNSLGGVNKAVVGLGIAAAAGGAAIAAGLAQGVKGAGDLEQAVANISTIAPEIDTGQVFAALNDMSTRVPQSAQQLGDSLYDIFSSIGGLSQDAALQLTETFAKGATAAGTDAKTFGTAITGVLNAYKLDVSEAGNVSDEFFAIVRDGVVTGEELATSLGPVTQAAKAAGVGFKDLGPLIAAVTKEGGPAAQNINNLNNFLTKFTTTDAQKGFKALGVAVTDSSGKFRDVPAILGDLKDALADMTEAERANALQTIFPDLQARQGAQTLMSQLDFVNQALADQAGQVGLTEAAYKKMSGTFNSQSKILQNSVTAALTTIGAALLPVITPMVTAFAQSIPGALKAAQAAFASLAVAGTPLVRFLKDLWGTIQQVFAGDWGADASINPVVNALGQLATFIRNVTIPNLLQLGDIATKALGGDFAGAFAGIGDIIGRTAAAVGPILQQLGQAFVDWIGPRIGPMLAALADLGGQLLGWIGAQLDPLAALLLAWGQQFIAWVAPQIPPLLAQLASLAGQFFRWIGAQVGPITAQLLAWGQEFVAWVGPQIPPLLAELGKLAADTFNWIVQQLPTLGTQLGQWANEFIKWVAPMIPKLLGELAAVDKAIGDWIVTSAPGIGAKAAEIGVQIALGIARGILGAQNAIGLAIVNAVRSGLGAGQQAAEAHSPSELYARELGEPLAAGVIEGFVRQFSDGSSAMNEAIRAVVGTALANGIPPMVALALAKAESGLNARAIGDQGHSVGLFQLHDQGMGAGLSTAQRQDPWENARRFLEDPRIKALAQQFFANIDPSQITPELVSKFGGLAEVSAQQFWGRYGEAFKALGSAAGPALADAVVPAVEQAKTGFAALWDNVANGRSTLDQLQLALVNLAGKAGFAGASTEVQNVALGVESASTALANMADQMAETNPQIAGWLHLLRTGQIDAAEFALRMLQVFKALDQVKAVGPTVGTALEAVARATQQAATASATPKGLPGSAAGAALPGFGQDLAATLRDGLAQLGPLGTAIDKIGTLFTSGPTGPAAPLGVDQQTVDQQTTANQIVTAATIAASTTATSTVAAQVVAAATVSEATFANADVVAQAAQIVDAAFQQAAFSQASYAQAAFATISRIGSVGAFNSVGSMKVDQITVDTLEADIVPPAANPSSRPEFAPLAPANAFASGSSGGGREITIVVPVNIDGRELDRIQARHRDHDIRSGALR